MSSNAFARSRPRVRHQRVPRAHTCDHPRFIQLVNELARINEAKKKQEESDSRNNCGDVDPGGPSLHHQQQHQQQQQQLSGNSGVEGIALGRCDSGCAAINQTTSVRQNIGNCCDNIDATSHTLNGYRPLDSNQSTAALHDNYYQHINNNNTHIHHQHQHYAHTQQLQPQHQQHYGPQQIVNNMHHPDDRCPAKSSSNNFGYSKQNVVVEQQQGSDLSNDNPDLRQDENRSKRKRSSNDPSMSSKKALTSTSSGTSVSKKHKSSPDGIRPLSPSFTKCPICLLDCMDRDPSFTNTCYHLFCYVCIENWTKNKATCPLCRTKFTKIIYNIKSATNYEEKIASPIRRDDDDSYVPDRLMLEHFTSLNSNPSAPSNRSSNSDEVQFLFENLHRNSEVLMPQYFVNQIDPRQRESLHSFNTVTTSANFSSNVPHSSFSATSYPIASNYIALFPNPTTTAITSAYSANTGLTNMTMNSDPNGRRVSRSGRLIYSRPNYEHPAAEVPARMSRGSIAPPNLPTMPIERAHHHPHQEQHSNHHQHHHHQHENRSSLDMSTRQIQRAEQPSMHFQAAFTIQTPRQYNPNAFARRTYNGSHDHQHILDSFYRHRLPDM